MTNPDIPNNIRVLIETELSLFLEKVSENSFF